MVQESILIEMNQGKSNILNSRSGFNRCLIPRLTVSLGDRVQEETVRDQRYSEREIDTIFEEKEKRERKSRGRGEGGNNNTNAPQPPPNKRRKFYTHTSEIDSKSTCSDREGSGTLEKKKTEQKQQHFFPIFNENFQNKANNNSRVSSHRRVQNKKKKAKSFPPTNNSKITDHFTPLSIKNKSEAPDDRGGDAKRGPGI